MHWVSHSLHSDLIHKFRRSIIKSSVINTVVAEKQALVLCAGRMHGNRQLLPAAAPQFTPHDQSYSMPGCKTVRVQCGPGADSALHWRGRVWQPGTFPALVRSRAARGHGDSPSPEHQTPLWGQRQAETGTEHQPTGQGQYQNLVFVCFETS